jgi:hypothetical protein
MQQVKIRHGIRRFQGEAMDAGHQPVGGAQIRRVLDDGTEIVEHIPTRHHVKMVGPAGQVACICVTGGSGRMHANDPYFLQLIPEKISAGWIHYGVCPKAAGTIESLPLADRTGAPCTIAMDGHPISNEHACACVEHTIAARTAKHNAGQSDVELRHRSKEAAEKERQEQQSAAERQMHAEQMASMHDIAERLAAQMPRSKRGE